jgi:hypothetical protein
MSQMSEEMEFTRAIYQDLLTEYRQGAISFFTCMACILFILRRSVMPRMHRYYEVIA